MGTDAAGVCSTRINKVLLQQSQKDMLFNSSNMNSLVKQWDKLQDVSNDTRTSSRLKMVIDLTVTTREVQSQSNSTANNIGSKL